MEGGCTVRRDPVDSVVSDIGHPEEEQDLGNKRSVLEMPNLRD